MTAVKSETVRIEYPKTWFAIGTAAYVAITVALFYLSWSSREDSTKAFWFIAGIIEGVLFFIFIVPPLFTSHLAGKKGLQLRMGLLISETIPYGWIKEVRETSIHWGAVKIGIGVRYSPITKTLFVTSSFENLVMIKFRQEHMFGRILRKSVSDIVLSVGFVKGFLDIMSEMTGIEKEV